MSYSAGEANILTLVQACSSYNTANTSRGDWKVLNKGTAATYAIVKPTRSPVQFSSGRILQFRWRTVIEVWERYKLDATTRTALEGHVAEIVVKIAAYPHLGGSTASNSDVIEIGEPLEMWKRGGIAWLRQDITVEWWEHVNITFAD